MLAQPAAAAIDDRSGRSGQAAVAGEEGALALAGEKAQVLALGLVATGSPAAAASLRTSGLVSSASGKRRRASESGRSPESM